MRLLLSVFAGCLLFMTFVANAESCLRYSDDQKLDVWLRQNFELGATYSAVSKRARALCSQAEIQSHVYEEKPLYIEFEGKTISVRKWIKITEGPFRFFRRLLLRTHIIALIYFGEKDEVVGYETKYSTDSL